MTNQDQRHFLEWITPLLIAGAFLPACGPKPGAGRELTMAGSAAGAESAHELTLGAFQVAVEGGGVRVTGTNAGSPTLLELSGGAFLTAAHGQEAVTSARGCFVFADALTGSCGGARITSAKREATGALTLRGDLAECGEAFTLELTAKDSERLQLVARLDGHAYNRLTLTYGLASNEHVYGFGHQYGNLDLVGRRLPIWSGEQGIGRGEQPISAAISLTAPGCAGDGSTTYTAVPAYVSTMGRGMAVGNTEYLAFDFTRPGRGSIDVWAAELRATAFVAPSPQVNTQPVQGAVEVLTRETGRMAPLPAWTQKGVMLRVRGGSQAARAAVLEAQASGAALASVWIEDWVGERQTPFGLRMFWNWEVDQDAYPDFDRLVQEFHGAGLRVLIYFNPFLTDASEKPKAQRNLYQEAKAQGLLVTQADGSPYPVGNGGFDAGLIDLTQAAGRDLIRKVMVGMLQRGVDGWMADFGEALPYDAQVGSGADPRVLHNLWPTLWSTLSAEAIAEAGRSGDALYFSRSGNLHSPTKTMAFWIGDQNTTWDDNDGIKTVIPALVSGGLSGFAIDHMDTGGWLSIGLPLVGFSRSKELEQRWLELGAFGALFRLHHTNRPDANWQYNSDPETLALFARMSRLYAALAPYRAELMAAAQATGLPLIRHPLLHYPADPEVASLKDQFMLGSDFMVAPVLNPGADSVRVYLPKGRWIHLWSGTAYGSDSLGQWVKVAAPIGQPAVFYPEGRQAGTDLVRRLRALSL